MLVHSTLEGAFNCQSIRSEQIKLLFLGSISQLARLGTWKAGLVSVPFLRQGSSLFQTLLQAKVYIVTLHRTNHATIQCKMNQKTEFRHFFWLFEK